MTIALIIKLVCFHVLHLCFPLCLALLGIAPHVRLSPNVQCGHILVEYFRIVTAYCPLIRGEPHPSFLGIWRIAGSVRMMFMVDLMAVQSSRTSTVCVDGIVLRFLFGGS
jgi:hypothetical protein